MIAWAYSRIFKTTLLILAGVITITGCASSKNQLKPSGDEIDSERHSQTINEPDERVALEMGTSLARMESPRGFDFILQKIENPIESYIPMEAVLMLTEIADSKSAFELMRIAT